MESEYIIQVENLTWYYEGTSKAALNNINLKIKKGETVLITGPAGAGKTTLAYCLNGIIPHFFPGYLQGRVLIKNIDTRTVEIGDISRMVGMVLQDYSAQLVQPTVIDDVAFALENFGFDPDEIQKRVEEAITITGLTGLENRNPHTLSGGEQQLCAIAGVLALKPEIIVLDEPVSSLDPIGAEKVSNLLRKLKEKENITMIIIEQRLDEFISWADKLIVLNEGKIIAEGKPLDVLNDYEKLELMVRYRVNVPQLFLLYYKLKKTYNLPPLKSLNVKDFPIDFLLDRPLKVTIKEHDFYNVNPKLDPIIMIRNLTYVYPNGVKALNNINVEFYQGEFVAIIGQNGSGKTTLLKHILGLLKPTSGKVIVCGLDTSVHDVTEISKYVGMVFQHPDRQLFKTQVKDEIAMSLRRFKLTREEMERRIDDILKLVELQNYKNHGTFNLGLGERKRLALAATLATQPKILLVDEPTTGQDLKLKIEIMELLKRLNEQTNITIIFVSHDMEIVAKYAKRSIIMSNGKILIDGPTSKVLRNFEILAKAHLKPPPIIELCELLKNYNFQLERILTVEDFLESLNISYEE
ncbi:MAG: energy-coupling factor transporter ATPase [Thermoproteota archaeon]|jgi:energy-coupling factor transport system ATP-binding protein|nr:energy-coupling factor transporter ATPase [Thermoproteota archaeon]